MSETAFLPEEDEEDLDALPPVRPSDRKGCAPVLSVSGVRKTFRQAGETLDILHNISLSLHEGEVAALVGPSGSGKSTLLQIIGLLDRPDEGRILIDDQDASALGDARRTALRRKSIGFVYQFHHLLPEFSALENIVLPQMIARIPRKAAEQRAMTLLHDMGLDHRMHHRPARLSGGERQRIAIARALANGPRLLLADEPTGNLDPTTAGSVFDVLVDLVRSSGAAALVATHNMDLADQMNRVFELRQGRIYQL